MNLIIIMKNINKKINLKYNLHEHPYHLVDPSPWPILSAISAFTFLIGLTMYMHSYYFGGYILFIGFTLLISSMSFWWKDIIFEARYEGNHTIKVQKGLKLSVILFIISEIMFFFAFFWAFFHSSLVPTIEIGGIWPPKGIAVFNPWEIPLLNTLILLSSGATVTWAHNSILYNNEKDTVYGLITTCLLGAIFTLLQLYEYITAPFNISDGIYGSVFYMATGFHGFHVLIGTIFLLVCLYRTLNHHFSAKHHLGFEAAAWYWHFVDVVWIFLFITIYWWGGC